MEKEIWIIKRVFQIAGNIRIDNVYAVSSEDEAKREAHKLSERVANENQNIKDYDVWFINEKIKLFD